MYTRHSFMYIVLKILYVSVAIFQVWNKKLMFTQAAPWQQTKTQITSTAAMVELIKPEFAFH
jgi:hypothetical protein